jgi:alanyl-tRNA synthetase
MTSKDLRKKFLDYFAKRGHKIVPSSSLVTNDPSVLFATAGMQQFKPYYLGQESPFGKNVASCQKCVRTSDIDEVGDHSHLTFFEMLGNFSFGGYGGGFKEEAIKLAYNFIFGELKLSLQDSFFTVFEGDASVPADKESEAIWKRMAGGGAAIQHYGRADNFWGPTGEFGPCGPTTEIHYRNTEIWNIVFNEYYQDKDKILKPLFQKGVDTGMGFERLLMMVQDKQTVYDTDLFVPIMEKIPGTDLRARRIVADHIKSSVFLISAGVLPSNLEKGYVLRRILRRAIRYGRILGLPGDFLMPLAQTVILMYREAYQDLAVNEDSILTAIHAEQEKFGKVIDEGLREVKALEKVLTAAAAASPGSEAAAELSASDSMISRFFDLYQSKGMPLELVFEEFDNDSVKYDKAKIREKFDEKLKQHQEISRAGAEKKFGGVGETASEEAKKLHTATHLLHAALRRVLGAHVKQMGSDITPERLRFDFSHPAKMTAGELAKAEELVNCAIKDNIPVSKEVMSYEEAIVGGALAFFREKYPAQVNVYSIKGYSKEICAGPHAEKTGDLGQFRIIKEESSSAGVRRIKAVLLPQCRD